MQSLNPFTGPLLTPESRIRAFALNATVPPEARRYSRETETRGIKLALCGHWSDLAAYYAGSDGNLWAWQGRFSNCGPLSENPQKRLRGEFWGLPPA